MVETRPNAYAFQDKKDCVFCHRHAHDESQNRTAQDGNAQTQIVQGHPVPPSDRRPIKRAVDLLPIRLDHNLLEYIFGHLISVVLKANNGTQ